MTAIRRLTRGLLRAVGRPTEHRPATPSNIGPALDIVFIERLQVDTVIGVDDDELHAPQPLWIDVAVGKTRLTGCQTDEIADTIDYGCIRAALHRLLATHGAQLLEALAELIARMMTSEFGAEWVRVAITKPHKFTDIQAVGVVIERSRCPSASASDSRALFYARGLRISDANGSSSHADQNRSRPSSTR